ncbi:MAG: histidinol-phosphate transaminase [Vallitaleaceae bacterium]|nr:histidinol-phosphate transaminase [Vallitaleaceae bacterium]
MTNIDMQFHGSDIEKVEKFYHIKKEEIVNFSGNVNPLGLSALVISELKNHIELISAYPDRDYTSLRQVIAKYISVHPDQILVGNGSTELISLFIKIIHPEKATIIGPTYSEYEREIRIDGGRSISQALKEENDFKVDFESLKEDLAEDTDLLVICNPNNPTSTAIEHAELRQILDYCLAHHIFVLIDETYVEFTDNPDNVTGSMFCETYTNLFIIRGVSKFFAAPGLRLGYAVTGNKELIHQMNSLKNPWTINSLAAYAGELMLQDTDYINKTKALIKTEKNKFITILGSWTNVKVYAPSANFILVKIMDPTITAPMLFESLIKEKIMIRDASGFPFLNNKYFRFCINKPEENDLLIEHLKKLLNQ